MKHVKLFEAWMDDTQSYKAISVFPEGGSDLYVGVFPENRADAIYQELSACQNVRVEIENLPAGHDVVVSELGGEGLMTGESSDLGWTNLVKLGDDFQFEEGDEAVPFLADKNIDGFVGVSGFGGTNFLSSEDMIGMCKNYQ